jgi:hypothetical protein
MNRLALCSARAGLQHGDYLPAPMQLANDSLAHSVHTSREAAIRTTDGNKNPSPPRRIPLTDAAQHIRKLQTSQHKYFLARIS